MSSEGQSLNNALSSLQSCSGCCEELRSEISVLKNQLSGKIDKSERAPIIEDSINGANARYGLAMVPVALPALAQLVPFITAILQGIAGLISLGATVLGIQNLVNGLQSLVSSQGSEIGAILGRLRFTEDKNTEQDQLLHYFRDYTIPILKADILILQRDLNKANSEIGKANSEIKRLDGELSKTNAEINRANIQINILSLLANDAIAKGNQALNEAKVIRSELENQYKPIIQLAISKADFALQTINNLGNDLIAELQTQSTRISQLEASNNQLQQVANSAATRANEAIRRADAAEVLASAAIARTTQAEQQTNTLDRDARNGNIFRSWAPNVIQPKVTEWARLATYNPEIVQPISIQEASRLFDIQRQQVQNDIRNAIVVSSPLGITSDAKLDRTITELRGQVTTNTQNITALQNVKADRTAIASASPILQAEVTSLRNRITQQEQMNERGLTEIGLMAGAIAALPNTLAQNSGYRAAMTDVAAAGTCQTTRPGGCMANQVQSLRNGQNDILNGLGLASQAGQGAVLSAMQNTLNTINSKLGAEIPGIGIGGKLSNFVNWSVADRVMNIVTMLSSLHNVLMLSNSVKETFLDILDNLFQTGFNIAPNIFKKADENEAVDSREFLGGALNSFFGSLFGVAEWAAIQAQWKAYSTIYSSSAQGINNIRELTNDVQELANINIKQTAELGNALVDEGVISEENWEHKDPKKKIKSKSLGRLQRMGQGIETLDTKLEAIEVVTSTLLNITNTAKEIKENIDEIEKAVDAANKAAKKDRDAKIEGLELPNFSLDDIF